MMTLRQGVRGLHLPAAVGDDHTPAGPSRFLARCFQWQSRHCRAFRARWFPLGRGGFLPRICLLPLLPAKRSV